MPFITQGKTNLQYILIVVILAVVVGGGILAYQFLLAPKEEPKIPEVKTPEEVSLEEVPADETADWKTYQSPNGGFQIDYPLEMTVETPKPLGLTLGEFNEGVALYLINDVTFVEILIESAVDIEQPTELIDPKFYAEVFQESPDESVEMSEVLIGGKVGYKLEFNIEPFFYKFFTIYLSGKNQKSLLAITAKAGNEQDSQTVDRMLSTFSFVE